MVTSCIFPVDNIIPASSEKIPRYVNVYLLWTVTYVTYYCTSI